MPQINHDAMAATMRTRLALRQKLLGVFLQKLAESGQAKSTFCASVGLNPKSMWHIEKCDGLKVSLDTMVLYLLRLGVSVDVTTGDVK